MRTTVLICEVKLRQESVGGAKVTNINSKYDRLFTTIYRTRARLHTRVISLRVEESIYNDNVLQDFSVYQTLHGEDDLSMPHGLSHAVHSL